MMRKTMTIAVLTFSLALAAGCSSEEECEGSDCSVFDPGSSDDSTVNDTDTGTSCADQCAHFEGCSIMDDVVCTAACEDRAFTPEEMSCFATAACGDALGVCLDIDDPFGERGF
jgi:hypothetical protein